MVISLRIQIIFNMLQKLAEDFYQLYFVLFELYDLLKLRPIGQL